MSNASLIQQGRAMKTFAVGTALLSAALLSATPAEAGLGQATSTTAASTYDAWCGKPKNNCKVDFKNQKITVNGTDSIDWKQITYITKNKKRCDDGWTNCGWVYTFGIEYKEDGQIQFAEILFQHDATAGRFWRDLRRACRTCVNRDADRIQVEVKQ